MTSKLLKVGIIGCGRMGLLTDPKIKKICPKYYLPYSHAEAVRTHPNLNLVGLCDTSNIALNKAKELYPDIPCFKDPEQLLNELNPDLICIATRTPQRFQLIELCIKNGVRLLHVEKPLCNSYSQLMQIAKMIEKTKAHFTFGAIRRYLAPYKNSIKLLNQGLIGDLEEVSFNLGRTILCWDHIHGIDLIQSILSPFKINAIRAVSRNHIIKGTNGNILDGDPEIAFIHFSTINGPQGIISCAGGNDLMFYGNNGIIGVTNDGSDCYCRKPFDENKKSYWNNTFKIEIPEDKYSGTASALDRLVNSNPKLAKEDSYEMINSQKLLFACVQSILSNGNPVDPNSIENDIYISGKLGTLYA